MLRELLGSTPLAALPLAATLLFLAIFLGVLLRVSKRARAAEYRRMADLPLADDDHDRRQA